MQQLFLDVETKSTFEEVGGYFPEKLGISFVGLYRRENFGEGELLGFFEPELPQLFPLLEQADLVIGFNLDGFDLPALSGYYGGDLTQIPTLDLLTRIKNQAGHRVSLDAVAQASLGKAKVGDGLDAIRYYREGNLQALQKYCWRDVEITRDLYDYGLRQGYVKFLNKWNRLVTSAVDFTYQPPTRRGVQLSLV